MDVFCKQIGVKMTTEIYIISRIASLEDLKHEIEGEIKQLTPDTYEHRVMVEELENTENRIQVLQSEILTAA